MAYRFKKFNTIPAGEENNFLATKSENIHIFEQARIRLLSIPHGYNVTGIKISGEDKFEDNEFEPGTYIWARDNIQPSKVSVSRVCAVCHVKGHGVGIVDQHHWDIRLNTLWTNIPDDGEFDITEDPNGKISIINFDNIVNFNRTPEDECRHQTGHSTNELIDSYLKDRLCWMDDIATLIGEPDERESSPGEEPKPQASPRKGMRCRGCGELNEWAEPNQEDGSYVCFACRNFTNQVQKIKDLM